MQARAAPIWWQARGCHLHGWCRRVSGRCERVSTSRLAVASCELASTPSGMHAGTETLKCRRTNAAAPAVPYGELAAHKLLGLVKQPLHQAIDHGRRHARHLRRHRPLRSALRAQLLWSARVDRSSRSTAPAARRVPQHDTWPVADVRLPPSAHGDFMAVCPAHSSHRHRGPPTRRLPSARPPPPAAPASSTA